SNIKGNEFAMRQEPEHPQQEQANLRHRGIANIWRRLPVSRRDRCPACHPERSEGSRRPARQILHSVQDDNHFDTDIHHPRKPRSFSIMPGRAFSTVSTSVLVFALPSVRRRLPCASSTGMPIAISTCDGSTEPEVHAEPVDAAIPSKSRLSRIDSPSTPSKQKLALLGSRLVGCPVR